MSHAQGGKAVVLALVGNGFLTLIKIAAYMISGSGAMLAEAVHSAADLGNQALLLIGMKKAERGPSEEHHFGYGKDRFLFALISAAGIFFVGCGVTITHGIHALLADSPHAKVGWIVPAVLAISFLVDGAVLLTAIRELSKKRGNRGWIEYIRNTPDTTTVAVLFEDGAASIGVLLAAAGIAASEFLGWHWADPVAAILIGLLLGFIALFLGAQNRGYLLDRALSADVQARILATIRRSGSSVKDIFDVRTRIVGADLYAFNADIEFDGKVISDRVQERSDVNQAFAALKTPEDLDRLLDEHARIVVEELGNEIDRIEEAVKAQVPAAKFIFLEVE